MLSQLYIENIAVIEKAVIDLHEGLNVLTGETGAGKSILIDSINAVLGERTSRDLVRTGSKGARVSALFSELSPETLSKIQEMGYDGEEESILLQRDISPEGKSICRINGRPATAAILREIGSSLLSIHGQHENYELLSPDLHMAYIDRMDADNFLLNEYQNVYFQWTEICKKLKDMQIDESEKARRMDLLNFQKEELESAQLREGEREELSELRTMYTNSEKISSCLNSALLSLDGDEDTDGAVNRLQMAADAVSDAVRYLPESENLAERLRSLFYDLEDCAAEIRTLIEKTEYDPRELENIEERLDLLYRLGMKYGSTEEEMLSYLQQCREELQNMEFSDEILQKLEQERKTAEENMKNLAARLSEKRRKVGKKFAERVKQELSFLNMPNIEFVAEQKPCDYTSLGCDRIQFLISTNPGEPPKPLAKIASGGELSRIMLAIKTVLAGNDRIGTLIFDEIDTGISGSAAHKVGLKLREVSKHRQVLCVTHSAQIAALADSHFLIEKHVLDGRTYTNVRPLEYAERVQELARIMGGDTITDLMLENSAEMLKMAQNS